MIKTACIETLFTGVPFEQRFELAKKAGFDYVEFWGWEDKNISRVANLLKENDLKLASFSGDKDYSLIDDKHFTAYLDYAKKSVMTAKRLGCRYLVIHSNALGEGGEVVNPYSLTDYYVLYGNMLKCLTEIKKIGEEHDVVFVLEALNTKYDHAGNFLKYTRDSAGLIRILNSRNVKILYDVYHMQIMEGDIANTIREYKNEIGYVHFADAPLRSEPWTGEINYGYFLSMLREIGYQGFIGYELFPTKSAEQAVRAIFNDKVRI